MNLVKKMLHLFHDVPGEKKIVLVSDLIQKILIEGFRPWALGTLSTSFRRGEGDGTRCIF